MDVRCDKCQTRYRVADGRIAPRGVTLRCGKCQNTFQIFRPRSSNGAPPASTGLLQVPMPFLTPAAAAPAAPPPLLDTRAAAAPKADLPRAPLAPRAPSPAAPASANDSRSRSEPTTAGRARPDAAREAPHRLVRVALAAALAAKVPGDPRAALIQGMADAQENGGAERAIPRLQAALSTIPGSARVHYRLALAYAALDDAAGARCAAAADAQPFSAARARPGLARGARRCERQGT